MATRMGRLWKGRQLTSGDFVEYTERGEQFFIANGIEDANKKTVVFITTVAGADTHSLLRSLLVPVKPDEQSYHLNPKPIVIAEPLLVL